MNLTKKAMLLFFVSLFGISPPLWGSDSYKVVGYYENWAQWRPDIGKAYPHQMDPSKVSHICYAFAYFNFKGPGISGPGKYVVTGDWKVYPVEWTDLNEVPDSTGQKTIAPSLYNQCTGYDTAQLEKFQMKSLNEENPNLKMLISIGGWNFCNPEDDQYGGKYTYQFFSQMVGNPDHRKAFIDSLCDYAKTYHFDGVDFDWEYPASDKHGGTADDYQNYLTFFKELRAQIQSSGNALIVTMASAPFVPSGSLNGTYQTESGATKTVDPSNPATYFSWLKDCSEYLDWFNVMCYDYYGPWPGQEGTLPNAPTKESGDLYSVEKTIGSYLDAGVDPLKVVIGVPSYGHSYAGVEFSSQDYGPGNTFTGPDVAGKYTGTPGFLAYYEIIDQIQTLGWLIGGFDEASETPYAYNAGGKRWVSYDNQDSIAAKMALIKQHSLGGAMMWSLDDDDFNNKFPLLTKINQELNP